MKSLAFEVGYSFKRDCVPKLSLGTRPFSNLAKCVALYRHRRVLCISGQKNYATVVIIGHTLEKPKATPAWIAYPNKCIPVAGDIFTSDGVKAAIDQAVRLHNTLLLRWLRSLNAF